MKMWTAIFKIVEKLCEKHPGYGLAGLITIMLALVATVAIGGIGIDKTANVAGSAISAVSRL